MKKSEWFLYSFISFLFGLFIVYNIMNADKPFSNEKMNVDVVYKGAVVFGGGYKVSPRIDGSFYIKDYDKTVDLLITTSMYLSKKVGDEFKMNLTAGVILGDETRYPVGLQIAVFLFIVCFAALLSTIAEL